jgi:hypothetical protein
VLAPANNEETDRSGRASRDAAADSSDRGVKTMARHDNRSILDQLEQLDIALEDDVPSEFVPEKRNPITRYFVADHHAAQTIFEMKDLMRATADLLEMEAARLRHELELLDMTADHSTLH